MRNKSRHHGRRRNLGSKINAKKILQKKITTKKNADHSREEKNPKPYNFLGPETDRKNACEGGDLFKVTINICSEFVGNNIIAFFSSTLISRTKKIPKKYFKNKYFTSTTKN